MENKYRVILADPPWFYKNSGTRAAATNHYPTLKKADLMHLPVDLYAADRCALFLWATWPNIKVALTVMDAWGFRYKTLAWEWLKTNKAGDKFVIGLGNYTRSNCEPCLLGFKGKPIKVNDRSVPAFIVSPRRGHSQKPDEQYEKIDRLYPDTTKLELFATEQREGWDVWGNEVESTIEIMPEWLKEKVDSYAQRFPPDPPQ